MFMYFSKGFLSSRVVVVNLSVFKLPNLTNVSIVTLQTLQLPNLTNLKT